MYKNLSNCLYAIQRIILPRTHKFAKPTNPLKKISCLLSKIFHSKESYASLANLCLLGRIILWIAYGHLSDLSAEGFHIVIWKCEWNVHRNVPEKNILNYKSLRHYIFLTIFANDITLLIIETRNKILRILLHKSLGHRSWSQKYKR